MKLRQIAMVMLMLALTATGLTACGKRGEPYRPSEIPAKSGDSTSCSALYRFALPPLPGAIPREYDRCPHSHVMTRVGFAPVACRSATLPPAMAARSMSIPVTESAMITAASPPLWPR